MTEKNIDQLVRLYDLPAIDDLKHSLGLKGINIRRPLSFEKSILIDWVRNNFSVGWADECEVCFSHFPVSAHIATHRSHIVGFSCHESTCKNFFGPIGLLDEYMGIGLGKALFITSLYAMRDLGYAYAIVGGPTIAADFYRKTADAVDIPGSTPGIYIDRLKDCDS